MNNLVEGAIDSDDLVSFIHYFVLSRPTVSCLSLTLPNFTSPLGYCARSTNLILPLLPWISYLK